MDHKQELLAKTVPYLLQNGLIGFSLRKLAISLGTSDRMILYYFKTKETLILESVTLVAQGIVDATKQQIEAKACQSPGRFIQLLWDLFTDPLNRHSITLFFEIDILSLREPETYQPIAQMLTVAWIQLIHEGLINSGLPKKSAESLSVNVASELIGLLLHFLINGQDALNKPLRSLIRRMNEHRIKV